MIYMSGCWHYQVLKCHLQLDGVSCGIWAIWSGAMWLRFMCYVAQPADFHEWFLQQVTVIQMLLASDWTISI